MNPKILTNEAWIAMLTAAGWRVRRMCGQDVPESFVPPETTSPRIILQTVTKERQRVTGCGPWQLVIDDELVSTGTPDVILQHAAEKQRRIAAEAVRAADILASLHLDFAVRSAVAQARAEAVAETRAEMRHAAEITAWAKNAVAGHVAACRESNPNCDLFDEARGFDDPTLGERGAWVGVEGGAEPTNEEWAALCDAARVWRNKQRG